MTSRFHVAIVGSGPAGLYCAHELLKANDLVRVDLYDRLPAMGGLTRTGIAPDHFPRRNVANVYSGILGASGRFRFFGNVAVGSYLVHDDLSDHYDAVVYATGCDRGRRLDLPGAHLPGCHSAREFVGWYNGDPAHSRAHFELGPSAAVVGNGNVALDVARMLVTDWQQLQARSDTSTPALTAFRESLLEEVNVLGRRGPEDAAFTSSELLQLISLPNVTTKVVSPERQGLLSVDDADFVRSLKRRILAATARTDQPFGESKRVVLRFGVSPTAVHGDGRVEEIEVEHNVLELDPESGHDRVLPSGRTERIPASLLLFAVGFDGSPIEGLPFDHTRGTIPHDRGRVVDPTGRYPVARTYVVGWAKRGPSGVVGTNKACAAETVASLLVDLRQGESPSPSGRPAALIARLRDQNSDVVDYHDARRIEENERAEGRRTGRPRVPFSTVESMLASTSRGSR